MLHLCLYEFDISKNLTDSYGICTLGFLERKKEALITEVLHFI